MKNIILVCLALCSILHAQGFMACKVGSANDKNCIAIKFEDGTKTIWVIKEPIITATDLKEVYPTSPNDKTLFFRLTKNGGEKMLAATKSMKKDVDEIAVILNNKVIISSPVSHNFATSFAISGLVEYSYEELLGLSKRIKVLESKL